MNNIPQPISLGNSPLKAGGLRAEAFFAQNLGSKSGCSCCVRNCVDVDFDSFIIGVEYRDKDMADKPKIPKTSPSDNQGITPKYLVSVGVGKIKN